MAGLIANAGPRSTLDASFAARADLRERNAHAGSARAGAVIAARPPAGTNGAAMRIRELAGQEAATFAVERRKRAEPVR